MDFFKMQANGNDYIYVDLHEQSLPSPAKAAVVLSDRHCGIGGDGLVLLCKSDGTADFRMRIFDPDGTEAEMCGNALQSAGALYAKQHAPDKKRLTVETLSGLKQVFPEWQDEHNANVSAEIGKPKILFHKKCEKVRDIPLNLTAISLGNPHCVVLTDDLSDESFFTLGPALETHLLFPARTNVEFLSVKDRCHFRMRTWERGCGETLSCATGSAAALVAAVLAGLAEPEAEIKQRGGSIFACWDQKKNTLRIRGKTQLVYTGTIADTLFCSEK